MSVIAHRYVIQTSNARGSPRMVLAVLAEYANDHGICWPSVETIAKGAQLSQRQTQRALRKLVAADEVFILQAGGGRKRTTRYLLRMGRSDEELRRYLGTRNAVADDTVSADSTAKPEGASRKEGRHSCPKRCHPRPETASGATPEPSVTVRGNQEQETAAGKTVAAAESQSEFGRTLAERRAGLARRRGGRAAKPIAAEIGRLISTAQGKGHAGNGAAKPKRPPYGRIPAAEQERTFEVLRSLPGLAEDDARELAQVAPCAAFEAVAARLHPGVRNVGGWLRTAVTCGADREA